MRLGQTKARTDSDDSRWGYILGWILTPLQLIVFSAVLCIFHPLQMLARVFGYQAHKKTVDYMCLFLLASLRIVGTKYKMVRKHEIPAGVPIVFVSNHQSMYDIPIYSWFFKEFHCKFIAKIELGKNLPSVSYNLRHGGSILIDRSNPRQALPEIKKFGQYIEQNRYAACIFTEGTRARTGIMRHFKPSGFTAMLKEMPSAVVVPVVIDGSWKLLRHKLRPIPFGTLVCFTSLAPIHQHELSAQEILAQAEQAIRSELGCFADGDLAAQQGQVESAATLK